MAADYQYDRRSKDGPENYAINGSLALEREIRVADPFEGPC